MAEFPFQIDIEQIFKFIYDLFVNASGEGLIAFVRATWDFLNFISLFLAPVLFFGVVYATIRLRQIHHAEHEEFEEEIRAVAGDHQGDDRWRRIISLANSDNPTEWRHAVIEADVMLDELLLQQGYIGNTLGERLKTVPKEKMHSLDAAWEAHKVRNEIAHAGSDFILTQREARRALDNYRKVFDEFHFI